MTLTKNQANVTKIKIRSKKISLLFKPSMLVMSGGYLPESMNQEINMGKKPLKMQCPSCGNYDNSECVETDPGHYRWNDETTDLFETGLTQ